MSCWNLMIGFQQKNTKKSWPVGTTTKQHSCQVCEESKKDSQITKCCYALDLKFSPSFLIQGDFCIVYIYYFLYSPPALPLSFLDALHCLPRAVGVPDPSKWLEYRYCGVEIFRIPSVGSGPTMHEFEIIKNCTTNAFEAIKNPTTIEFKFLAFSPVFLTCGSRRSKSCFSVCLLWWWLLLLSLLEK